MNKDNQNILTAVLLSVIVVFSLLLIYKGFIYFKYDKTEIEKRNNEVHSVQKIKEHEHKNKNKN